jgi:hypothetical protein
VLDCHFGNFPYPTYPIVDVWSFFLNIPRTFQQRKIENYFLTFLNCHMRALHWDCEKLMKKEEINLFCDREKNCEREHKYTVKPQKNTSKSTTEKITQHVVCSMDCRYTWRKNSYRLSLCAHYMYEKVYGDYVIFDFDWI